MRRTALRRVAPLRTTKLAGKRPRDTGPDAKTRVLVKDRAGDACERCGVGMDADRLHLHHRKLRRSRDHTAQNLIAVCSTCHEQIHHSPEVSMKHGWIVRQDDDPSAAPVLLFRGVFTLCSEGTKVPV